MPMNKKLSIITVCYNEKNVESTCLSIINQTWQDFEWIVIDGGSEPWCTDILEKYRAHMTFYVSEKDSGVYHAMNKGISQAKGEYLLFMNSGDSFLNTKTLEKVSAYFPQNADIFYGDLVFKMPDGSYTYKILPSEVEESFFIEDSLAHQATYIKATLFQTYGNYNEKYRIVSDLEKWIQFIQARCSFVYLPFLCTIFNCDGISTNVDEKGVLERAQLMEKYFSPNTVAKTFAEYLCVNPYALTSNSQAIAITNDENIPKQPDISIIVPVFNTSRYIKDCLDSLLSQSHINLEIICIDDGSYDNSFTILKEYAEKDARIRIYSFEENVGVATCRNFGLSKANGEYISFVDSDDWIAANFCEKLFEQAKTGKHDLIKGGVYYLYDDGTHTLSEYNENIKSDLKSDHFIDIAHQQEFTSFLYRKSFLQKIHAEFPKINNGENAVFLFSILAHKPKAALVEDVFYYYRQRQDLAHLSYSALNIYSYFKHFEMQCALLNTLNMPQSEYMNFYHACIYESMMAYYKEFVFPQFTSKEQLIYVRHMINIIKQCTYLATLIGDQKYAFLKNFVFMESVAQSDMLLFVKEIHIGRNGLRFSSYKYQLLYKLSSGKKRVYYKHKYRICKRIKQLELN